MIIDRIHEFNRFGMVLGLDRMEELLRRLGNPQDDLKVIHVAGTNGKGSVSKYLEEGLSACGYKMGLYTSPYIETFNERIRYDGADISDEDLEKRGGDALYRAAVEGDEKTGDFLAGQISGMIHKEQPAAEIIREMFEGAEEVLKGAGKWVK